jgi:hypothetical protein
MPGMNPGYSHPQIFIRSARKGAEPTEPPEGTGHRSTKDLSIDGTWTRRPVMLLNSIPELILSGYPSGPLKNSMGCVIVWKRSQNGCKYRSSVSRTELSCEL